MYLGSWVDSTDKDIKIRKAQAWQALNKMNCMWNSNMRKEIKVRFFVAAVESILLYGYESWTVTPKIECMLNGKMLRKATNVKWWEHQPNAEVYEELQLLCNKIAARRMKLNGHCHPELAASSMAAQPNSEKRKTQSRLCRGVEAKSRKSANRSVYSDGRPDCLGKSRDCSPVGDQIIIILTWPLLALKHALHCTTNSAKHLSNCTSEKSLQGVGYTYTPASHEKDHILSKYSCDH